MTAPTDRTQVTAPQIHSIQKPACAAGITPRSPALPDPQHSEARRRSRHHSPKLRPLYHFSQPQLDDLTGARGRGLLMWSGQPAGSNHRPPAPRAPGGDPCPGGLAAMDIRWGVAP